LKAGLVDRVHLRYSSIQHFKDFKNMEERRALASFAALSQKTRLHIVRMLVVAGPDGMAAGVIGEKADV